MSSRTASRGLPNLLKALPLGQMPSWRSIVIPLLVAATSLTAAFVGAAIVGGENGIDSVNLFVERLSGNSSTTLGGLVGASSLFALAAGLASAVNPCGFAMLPAYLGMYLGDKTDARQIGSPVMQLGKALKIGGTVTIGFVLLFGVVGAAIGLGASFVSDLLPWLGLTIGIGLALVGAWMIGGGKLYTGIAARAANRMGNPGEISTRGYLMFGLSYGTASLSCTLPIFLAVVGISVAGASTASVVGNFFLFALGMGSVIMALTIGMAFFKGTMTSMLRKALPFIQPFGSVLMVLAGTYIVFYWLTIGGIIL